MSGSKAKATALVRELGETVAKEAREQKERAQGKWRHIVTGDENTRVRDLLRQKRDKLLEKLKKPVAVKAKDKISFTLGVCSMIITEWVLLKEPKLYPLWYSVLLIPLLIARWHIYKKLKWRHFIFDFCYFVNLACLVQIWFVPSDVLLSRSIFVFANGPLIWAVPTWRNSLVFHSLDKTTSLFIHVLPPLLTVVTRWYPTTISSGCAEDVALSDSCFIDWAATFKHALVFYFSWQVAYMLKTDVADHKKFVADPDLQTSMRWFVRAKRGMLYNFATKVARQVRFLAADEVLQENTWKARIVFMVSQFVYTVVTAIPTILLFNNFYLHVGFVLLIIAWSIYNGANFYIEIFSKAYQARIRELIAEQETDRRESDASQDSMPSDFDDTAAPVPAAKSTRRQS